MAKQKVQEETLQDIMKVNNGYNLLTNNGIGFKDVKTSFEISLFKKEAQKLIEAFQEAIKVLPEEQQKDGDPAIKELLETKYKIKIPRLSISVLEGSEKEIPLLAFDFLGDYVDS